jgi:hypothetical protein
MQRTLAALSLLTAACATHPSAQETLPRLREAMGHPVSTDELNKEHSKLAEYVSERGQLDGLNRSEVEKQLGRGEDCGRHPVCAERGFEPTDWYYEVGKAGENYTRYRPQLIVGFNSYGTVNRTFVLRVE